MPPFSPGQTLIRTVQLPANGADALLARLRLESILQRADLQPAGLPPAAILVVRRLEDRTLAKLMQQADTSTLRQPLAWEQTVRSVLSGLAVHAARPLDAPAPANAEAVLFRDSSEMLACLWLDWLAGRLAEHWWWRSLYPQAGWPGSAEKLVLAASLEAVQDAPAAVEIMARRGSDSSSPLTTWARRLDESTARQITQAVLAHFGLPAVEEALQILPPAAPAISAAEQPAHPYIAIVPESAAPALPPAAQDLLGITLLLRRAPGLIRSIAFAERLVRWQAAGRPMAETEPTTSPTTEPSSNEVAASPIAAIAKEPESHVTTGTVTAAQGTLSNTPIATPSSLPATEIQPWEAALPERIHTDCGGLFYLLNLAIYLGIYNDFTQPANPGWELSPWDLLSLLGQRWLGDERQFIAEACFRQHQQKTQNRPTPIDFEPAKAGFEGFVAAISIAETQKLTNDPLWPLLARLAGRAEDTPPGEGFTPPVGWQLDGESPGPEWLAWLSEKMLARWELALGSPKIAPYLMQPAMIQIAASRLDVTFSLDQHPIELRLAGLDRDPGWLPAAGMAVYYHYE
jgi:hypothetical protein